MAESGRFETLTRTRVDGKQAMQGTGHWTGGPPDTDIRVNLDLMYAAQEWNPVLGNGMHQTKERMQLMGRVKRV